MRLETCLLYAALAALAMSGYRRLSGAGTRTVLAGLMYAVNEAHAHSLSMVPGRNTLLYSALGLLALLGHDADRTAAKRGQRWLARSAFALALFSGEGGIATLGYLAAYALIIDRGTAAQRARSLLPYGLITLLWAIVYASGDYGGGDSAFYRDPRADPWGTLLLAVLDLPVWLASQLSFGFATASIELAPYKVRLASAAITLLLGFVPWPTLREPRIARFYGAGLLLSLGPLLLTVPQDRLLVLSSFGGFGLLGCFLEQTARSLSACAARWLLLTIHLGIAPLAFIPSYCRQHRARRDQGGRGVAGRRCGPAHGRGDRACSDPRLAGLRALEAACGRAHASPPTATSSTPRRMRSSSRASMRGRWSCPRASATAARARSASPVTLRPFASAGSSSWRACGSRSDSSPPAVCRSGSAFTSPRRSRIRRGAG